MNSKRKKYAKILVALIIASLIGLVNVYVILLKSHDNSENYTDDVAKLVTKKNQMVEWDPSTKKEDIIKAY